MTTTKTQSKASRARISLAWLKDFKSIEDKQNFEKQVILHLDNKVTHKLIAIIKGRIDEIRRKERTQYSSASWAYEQAHRNGQIDELQWILTLLGPTR